MKGKKEDINQIKWLKNYELAKSYYNRYGNLNVNANFKTKNGIDYLKNGFGLGKWVYNQRAAYNGKGSCMMDQERARLLSEIGIDFEIRNNEEEWNKKYELAKNYYEENGDLNVPFAYKCKDGTKLGQWIHNQKQAFLGVGTGVISEEQIHLLESIGLDFNNCTLDKEWNRKYEAAKSYYEEHNDLEVPFDYKTKDGICLGTWIYRQRYLNLDSDKKEIKEKIKLLKEIGMRFDTRNDDEEWNNNYELAKKFYEEKHNLDINSNFITEDGTKLGSWIYRQKQAYLGKRLISQERIKLLEDIGINWYSYNVDKKYQLEEITNVNKIRKQKEILNRTYTLLNKYKEDYLPTKNELNEEFIRQLRR